MNLPKIFVEKCMRCDNRLDGDRIGALQHHCVTCENLLRASPPAKIRQVLAAAEHCRDFAQLSGNESIAELRRRGIGEIRVLLRRVAA